MKNYFNAKDRSYHILLLAMEKTAHFFKESDSLSDKERYSLKKCEEWLEKFNNLVFERLGEPYRKKVKNTTDSNELSFCAKNSLSRDVISYCASEDVSLLAQELQQLKCWECSRTDFKDCGVYACLVATDKDGNNKESGCPFSS